MKDMPLKILFAFSVVLPLFACAAESADQELPGYDAAVISACIDVIAPALSQAPSAYRENIHVAVLDEQGWAQLGPQLKTQFHPHTVPEPFGENVFQPAAAPQAPADSTRLEVRAADGRTQTIDPAPLITSLQLRLQAGWQLPQGISSAGYTLLSGLPRQRTDELVLLLAPPGYGYTKETALVAAALPPPRQATAACLLRWQHKKWHILNYRLNFHPGSSPS